MPNSAQLFEASIIFCLSSFAAIQFTFNSYTLAQFNAHNLKLKRCCGTSVRLKLEFMRLLAIFNIYVRALSINMHFCCFHSQWLQLIQGCTCCSNCRLLIYSHHISAVAWKMLQFAILPFSFQAHIYVYFAEVFTNTCFFSFGIYSFCMLIEFSDFGWCSCVIGGQRLVWLLCIICKCECAASSW